MNYCQFKHKRLKVPVFQGLSLLLAVLMFILASPASAQVDQPAGAVYIVQSGDTLWEISVRFGISMQELQDANGITDPNSIKAGDQLLIPGLEGIDGVLTTTIVPLGETLASLSRLYDISTDTFVQLNRLTSPQEIYAGMSLITPQQDAGDSFGQRAGILGGQSLLETAVLNHASAWSLVEANFLEGTWAAIPGDVLRTPGDVDPGPGALPETVTVLEINELYPTQGQTIVITLTSTTSLSLTGFLGDYPLHFFDRGNNQYVALQGIHAMQNPGLYPILLQGTGGANTAFGLSQSISVQNRQFGMWALTVDPATIDPANTRPEDELWFSLASPATSIKMWDGSFAFPAPADFYDCYTSWYGERRSYNDSPYNYFHTGLDVCTGAGTEIYAVAPGTVVFAGPLTVRGNAVMIDHGWGVYTAYMHLSETQVKAGDQVDTGQLIGISGGTGRVAGPHLHWEVIVGGVQVEPEDWLAQQYP